MPCVLFFLIACRADSGPMPADAGQTGPSSASTSGSGFSEECEPPRRAQGVSRRRAMRTASVYAAVIRRSIRPGQRDEGALHVFDQEAKNLSSKRGDLIPTRVRRLLKDELTDFTLGVRFCSNTYVFLPPKTMQMTLGRLIPTDRPRIVSVDASSLKSGGCTYAVSVRRTMARVVDGGDCYSE